MTEDHTIDTSELLSLTTEIVSAQVSNNETPANDLSNLIQSVFDRLRALAGEEPAPAN